MSSVVRAQYRVWLEVDHGNGYVTYDCSSVSLRFGLNKIPSATVALASGRKASNPTQYAAIHDNAADFVSVRPARIWLHATGSSNPVKAEQWTDAGPQIIFEGYLSGPGYRRTYNSALPTVTLTHWIADLDFSSILSESSHPANPARFRWHPSAPGSIAAEATKPEGISSRVSRDLILPDNFMGTTGDLWGKCLHKVFADLADSDILWRFNEDSCVAVSETNKSSQKALARIETSNGVEAIGPDHHTGASSPYHVPLRMNTGPIEGLVADAIYEHLREATLDSYFNSTFWNKVVGELAPSYYFSVVPRIKTAMVVPFVPGLQETFRKTIDFRDVTDWNSSASSVRPLRAVGVMPSNMKSFAGEGMTVPVNVLGGCFTPENDPDRPGMIIYRTPPQWLDNVPLHAHKPFADPKNQPSSTTPVAPTPKQTGDAPITPGEAMNEMKNYYDQVAHYMFAQEMLRGRYAVLEGKLRFDIAPGTTVLIKNSPPKFLPNDQLSINLVASVSRVGIAIDAESGAAATSFQIDYIRSEAENASDATSIAGHPFYAKPFVGAPLLHEYLFEE